MMRISESEVPTVSEGSGVPQWLVQRVKDLDARDEGGELDQGQRIGLSRLWRMMDDLPREYSRLQADGAAMHAVGEDVEKSIVDELVAGTGALDRYRKGVA